MKIPSVKYMRDFYPAEMRLRDWIEGNWRSASLRAGFEPWDSPILESLELYKRKSGDEIVGQLYTLTTKGGEELAIRPEMTPSLARMISARQSALPRPIKWFCAARMCRYERGQRGRLREFWQWNIDLLGVPGPAGDAEVISVALDGLEACGLNAEEIEVRINSRSLMAALLEAIGIPAERHAAVYAVTDKRGKIPADALQEMYRELKLGEEPLARLLEVLTCESLEDLGRVTAAMKLQSHQAALTELEDVFRYLDALGKKAYLKFDIGIVRGLAYYTGPVFEIYDRASKLRALCGGGRYDRLLETMGGQAMPAVGFGMGDVVLSELLADLKKLPTLQSGTDFVIVPLEEERVVDALRITGMLRQQGRSAEATAKAGNLGKAFKKANESGAKVVVLVGGREWEQGSVRVKDLQSGTERDLAIDGLVSQLTGQA
jgi:histidyl-tRNA synthetase